MRPTYVLAALLAIGAAGCGQDAPKTPPPPAPKVEIPRPPEAPVAAPASGAPATDSAAPAGAGTK